MTRTCAVFNCKTNCKVRLEGSFLRTPYKPVFKFPYVPTGSGHIIKLLEIKPEDSLKITKLKKNTLLWVNSMPNDKKSLLVRNTNGICIDHFLPSDYKLDSAGRTRLVEGAIPSPIL